MYPKDWGLNYDYYRHYSKYGTGWNKASNLFHLEFKTHAWLRFQVLENLYIGNAMCYGEYIDINKTFNAGDIVTINMASSVEFGKKGQVSSNSANITAYYILPFTWHNFIKEESNKYIKEYYKSETQYNYLRDHYYKSKVQEVDNNRRYFRNGFDKFVEDDTLSSLLDLDTEVKNMKMINESTPFGDTEQLYYIYNYPYGCKWFNEMIQKDGRLFYE
ncbi:hypothetical protein [Clostridium kluyveri]|uniref:Uncharacterized protein n=2 Tax=Clostridium kluyveri TaxID=1534 RepID=A5N5E9_CLOK5|nr:hypothetical protein [Clostridium kluyveri]EDK32530.1 Hypothetical protein CKL_0476 [Clostridium kluyveri DSM 555]BAH05471.1 hypothetical protein CKR_0420 [Clostridium kluyveri NBRC 12016]